MHHAVSPTICLLLALAGCAAGPGTGPSPAASPSGSQPRSVATPPGSPAPRDVREPHVPAVDVLSDMDALYAMARGHAVPAGPDGARRAGPRQVVVVAPGRLMIPVPMFDPVCSPVDPVRHAASVLGTAQPLSIAAIGHTEPAAPRDASGEPTTASADRAIPFLGHLDTFAHAGHAVVVHDRASHALRELAGPPGRQALPDPPGTALPRRSAGRPEATPAPGRSC